MAINKSNLILDESTQILTGNEVPPPSRKTRGKIWKGGKLVNDYVDKDKPEHSVIRTEGSSFRPQDDNLKEQQAQVNAAGGSATVGTVEDPTEVKIPEGINTESRTEEQKQQSQQSNPNPNLKSISTDEKKGGAVKI